jgi:hypothetical protein
MSHEHPHIALSGDMESKGDSDVGGNKKNSFTVSHCPIHH